MKRICKILFGNWGVVYVVLKNVMTQMLRGIWRFAKRSCISTSCLQINT